MKTVCSFAALLSLMLLSGCGGSDSVVQQNRNSTPRGNLPVYNCSVLNSAADEFAPVVASTTRVFFTSNRRQEGSNTFLSPEYRYGEAVYVVERNTDDKVLQLDKTAEWTRPLIFRPEVFGKVNTGTLAMDGKDEMYLSSASYIPDAEGGADLFRVSSVAGAMSAPQALDRVNSPWWDAQPAVSPDGSLLIFASDRVAAQPSVDDQGNRQPQLWLSTRQEDGSWGAPELLPAPINSGKGEMSPHFDANGMLYFATLRWPEQGFDIVSSSRNMNGTWSEPVRLAPPVNSDGNDVFPYVTPDRLQLLLASDRPGGAGGYDIWAAEVPYCINVIADVTLLEPDNDNTTSSRPGVQVAMKVIDVESGSTVLEGRTDTEGRFAPETCLRAGRKYILRPGNEACFQASEPVAFTTPVPDASTAMVPLTVELRRPMLPEFEVLTDTIPFFVTGYWYPNTSTELQRLRERMRDEELPNANFIDLKDYDYSFAAQRVDRWFSHLYSEIENMIVPMLDTCYTGVDTLVISVLGHVDPRGLAWGRFDEDETVQTQTMTVAPGTVMQKQDGNVKLSHLRAYYTMRMIDSEMRKRSDRYALLRDQRRIRILAEGAYIAEDAGRDINDPYQRKFIVNVEVRHGHH
ncbi:hypothetical protein KQI65_16370 [bacterium]|nr:hypothetical protein [bacterium]